MDGGTSNATTADQSREVVTDPFGGLHDPDRESDRGNSRWGWSAQPQEGRRRLSGLRELSVSGHHHPHFTAGVGQVNEAALPKLPQIALSLPPQRFRLKHR